MDTETSTSAPPAWAEAILRMVLPPRHRESVTGDLLEEYRESVLPARGPSAADSWYVRQTGGFVLRVTWWWGALSAAAVIARDAFDWFVPPETFQARASASTYTAVALFLVAGFFTAWRSRSLGAGVLAGITTGVISALFAWAGSLIMLGLWHDERTLRAIERSGGLSELLTQPILVVLPGTIVATLGGALAFVVWKTATPHTNSTNRDE